MENFAPKFKHTLFSATHEFEVYDVHRDSRKKLFQVAWILLLISLAWSVFSCLSLLVTTLLWQQEAGISFWQTFVQHLQPPKSLAQTTSLFRWLYQLFQVLKVLTFFWILPTTILCRFFSQQVGTKNEKRHFFLGVFVFLFGFDLLTFTSGILLMIAAHQTLKEEKPQQG